MKRVRETDDDGDGEIELSTAAKAARKSDESVSSDKKESSSSDDDELAAWPDWYRTSTKEEQDAMDKKMDHGPDVIVLSHEWPCGECEKWTPHTYIRGPPLKAPTDGSRWDVEYDKEYWSEGQPGLSPRTVECMVCDAIWNHHVNFKGMPRKRHELIRLWYTPPPKEEEAISSTPAPTVTDTQPQPPPESVKTEAVVV